MSLDFAVRVREGLGAVLGLYELAVMSAASRQSVSDAELQAAAKRLRDASGAMERLPASAWEQVRKVRVNELHADTIEVFGIAAATGCEAARTLAWAVSLQLELVDHAAGDGPNWFDMTVGIVQGELPLKPETGMALQRLNAQVERELAALSAEPEAVNQGDENRGKQQEELTGEAKALALLVQHPEWTDTEIAEAVPCSRTTLYDWPKYKTARAALKQGRRQKPRGTKDRDGNLEAWR